MKFTKLFMVTLLSLSMMCPISFAIENEAKENISSSIVESTQQKKSKQNISQQKQNTSYYISEFKHLNQGNYIYLQDKYGTQHEIGYNDLYDIGNGVGQLKFTYWSSEQYYKSGYLYIQMYKVNGAQVIEDDSAYWNVYDQNNITLTHNLYKDYYNNEYLYFGIGIVESQGAQFYEDYQIVKIKNPLYKPKSDIAGHWAQPQIEKFMELGFVTGYNQYEFKPDNDITRAEFIKIVNKVYGFKIGAYEGFSDVNPGAWYYNDVKIALKAGYISPNEKTFRPNDSISREEAACIITSLKHSKDNNLDKIKLYRDYKHISSWALSSVEGAIENGYMGVGVSEFRPSDNITRAEAVVTLHRIK